MLFSEALTKDGTNKETFFQPLKLLGLYSYNSFLRNNTKRKNVQVKKLFGKRSKCAMHGTSKTCNYKSEGEPNKLGIFGRIELRYL